MYTGISSISWTELVMKHSFNGIVNPFKVVTFWVYAMCPAFLALLTFTFWNHMQNDQKLLLNLRGILEMTLSQLLFHFGKQAEITRSQIRWAKRMREHSHTARMHWQSSTIQHNVMVNKLVLVPPLFWMFSADLLPEVMLVNHLAWRNKLLMNNNWQSKKKKSINMFLMSKMTVLLSANVARPCFSNDKTTVWFLGYKSKPRFCFLNFWCSFPQVWSECHAYALCLQFGHQKLWSARKTPKTNTSWEAIQRVIAAKLIRLPQKTLILWHLVAATCITCHFQPWF